MNNLVKKKEELEYYVTYDKYILDLDYKYIYCQWHFDTRLKEDENGFIICEKCNAVVKSGKELK